MRRLSCHELSDTGNFKRCLFNRLTQLFKSFSANFFQCFLHNTGAADTDINHRIRLCHSEERTCHKRVIIRSVTENNKFCTPERISFFRLFCCCFYNLAAQAYRIHIDPGLCRTYVYGTADPFCLRQRLRDRTNQILITFRHSLGYQSRITTDKIDPYFICCSIQRFCDRHKIFRTLTCSTTDQSNRSNGNSFIHNRNPEFFFYITTYRYKIFCRLGNLIVYFTVELFQIRINTIEKTDAERNRSYIQILMLDHFISFGNFIHIDHIVYPLYPVSSYELFSYNLCIFSKISSL